MLTPVGAWHQSSGAAALAALAGDGVHGLSQAEAARRLAQHGPNELRERALRSAWRILLDQLASAMVVVLLVAAAVSVVLRDYQDAAVIAAIVVLNTALGFSQEYRAERALAALRRLAAPASRVRRDGQARRPWADTAAQGGWFFVLLGLGFLATYVVGWRWPAIWPLFPAAALALFGAALLGRLDLRPLAGAVWIGAYWPVILILTGVWLLVRSHR